VVFQRQPAVTSSATSLTSSRLKTMGPNGSREAGASSVPFCSAREKTASGGASEDPHPPARVFAPER
jgi:hypothetical protein